MVAGVFLGLAVMLSVASADTVSPLTAPTPTTTEPMLVGSWCEDQNGFDFVGHDVLQVPGPVSSCCHACQVAHVGCQGWSWTDWKNGTCFLKDAVDKIVENPHVHSSRLFPVVPLNGCREEANVDYEDPNIASVKAPKAHDCCDICRGHQGCRYYAWNNYDGGTCWLKATGDKKVAKLNVWAAQAYSTGIYTTPPPDTPEPPGVMCEDQNGFDFVDHDLKQVPGTVDTCCTACRKTNKCEAWTWSAWNNGTCFLKDGVDKIIENPNVRSSRKFPVVPLDGCHEIENTDYDDANLASVKAPMAHDCCEICRKHQGCRYYAWNNFEGGTCWLKATGDKKISKDGVWAAQAYSTHSLI